MARIRCEATLFWLRAAMNVGLWIIIRPGWQCAKNTRTRGVSREINEPKEKSMEKTRTVDKITNDVGLEAGGSH